MELSYVDHLKQVQTDDHRNVQERYRWWDHEEIVRDLEKTRSKFVSIFSNFEKDFNVSSGIRSGLFFNTAGAYVVGNRKWDRRGAVGAHHYMPVDHMRNMDELISHLQTELGYRIVVAEIADEAVPLFTYEWAEKSAVIFGSENSGVPQEVIDRADDVVYIPGNGSVRSLNVAATATTFMYDYELKKSMLE